MQDDTWGNNDTSHIVNEPEVDYRREKFTALFQARTILSKVGTMEERRVCLKQLKRMKKEGINAV